MEIGTCLLHDITGAIPDKQDMVMRGYLLPGIDNLTKPIHFLVKLILSSQITRSWNRWELCSNSGKQESNESLTSRLKEFGWPLEVVYASCVNAAFSLWAEEYDAWLCLGTTHTHSWASTYKRGVYITTENIYNPVFLHIISIHAFIQQIVYKHLLPTQVLGSGKQQ